MSTTKHNITETNNQRRSFLKKLWIGLGILAGAETLYLISGFLFPKRTAGNVKPGELFTVGNIDNFKFNSVTPFRNHKFFISRSKDGGFLALSTKCTHLGCNIVWEEKTESFICPCHSSWFNKEGNVMHPPATRPLSVHPVVIDGNLVKVNTGVALKRNSIDDTVFVCANRKGKKA